MTRQYDRKISLVVGNQAGDGIELSDLRISFSVYRGDTQTPNSADIRIYNLADTTASRIANPAEFTQLALQAGYEGNFGLIFRGGITQVRKGRIDGKDTYLDITAADGDEAYNYSSIAYSMVAGSTPEQHVQAFLQAMQAHGVSGAPLPQLSDNGLPRGAVFYGCVKDELRKFAQSNDVLWSIQDGQLTFVPQTGYRTGEVPVISPATGLIGVPEQTQNGLSLRVLLNPAIRIGGLVKLDSAINLYRYGLDTASTASNRFTQTAGAKLNADGLYYVMVADHSGDTRGNPWYTDLVCLAPDAAVTSQAVGQYAIADVIPRY